MAKGAHLLLVVGLVAVLSATFVAGFAPAGAAAAGVGAAPPLLRAFAREHDAGQLGRGLLRVRACSPQLHLRGAGDDEEDGGEEAAEGEEAGDEGDGGEEGGDEDDPDAGPMTITKAIRQVGRQCLAPVLLPPSWAQLVPGHRGPSDPGFLLSALWCRCSTTRGTTTGWRRGSRRFARRSSAARPSLSFWPRTATMRATSSWLQP
jgi:hypothetical protein